MSGPPVPPPPAPPRYADGSLADLLPALLAAGSDRPGPGPLGLPPARAAVLLLVDGLGAELLDRHAADAPFLAASRSGRTLTGGFPATTAASITSIGTGLLPGRHGVVGLRMATPDRTAVLDTLRWAVDDGAPDADVTPERLQPNPTVFEAAQGRGVVVAPPEQRDSGLTRAALRGARFVSTRTLGDLVGSVAGAAAGDGALVYAYHGDLDLVGHRYGPGSPPWRHQLRIVDRLAEVLAGALPAGTLLAVTGDHGMVEVDDAAKVDLDAEPDLLAGVAWVGGEPRVPQLYVRPGALDDVLAAWTARLGDRMWVRTGEQAMADGWFGPDVAGDVRPRIGDVVAAAYGDMVVVRRQARPREARLAGHHGSLTPAELLVPLLLRAA